MSQAAEREVVIDRARKWRNLALLSLAELLAMTLWFSASAVVPQLTEAWNLTGTQQSWVTMSVQLGFVTGALLSAAISELSDPRYVGTALTVQTSVGFLITMLSIHMIPELVGWMGWESVFMILSIGPALGIISMARLRRLPEATRMASGRR